MNSRSITWQGKTFTMEEWAKELGLTLKGFESRYYRWGMVAATFTPKTPTLPAKPRKDGKTRATGASTAKELTCMRGFRSPIVCRIDKEIYGIAFGWVSLTPGGMGNDTWVIAHTSPNTEPSLYKIDRIEVDTNDWKPIDLHVRIGSLG